MPTWIGTIGNGISRLTLQVPIYLPKKNARKIKNREWIVQSPLCKSKSRIILPLKKLILASLKQFKFILSISAKGYIYWPARLAIIGNQ